MFGLTGVLVLIAVLVLLFAVCREIVCWYWKTNEGLRIARENQKILLDIQGTLRGISRELRPPPDSVWPEAKEGQGDEAETDPFSRSVDASTLKPLPDLEAMKYGPLMDLAKELGVPFQGMPPKEDLIRMIKEGHRRAGGSGR